MPRIAEDTPVRNVREGPQARNDLAAILEGESVSIDVSENDLAQKASMLWSLDQEDPGEFTAAGDTIVLDSGATVTFIDGEVFYDAGTAFDYLIDGEIAIDSFTYSIRMANGRISYATVEVTITGDNSPPDAVDDAFSVSESGTTIVDVLANDTDPDGDTLVVTSVTQPAEGTVSIVGGDVVFDPGTTFEGLVAGQTATVSFDYEISDGAGGSDTATAEITVVGEGVFDPPTVSDSESTTLDNDQNVTLTLSGPGQTNDGTSDITIEVGLGLVAQPTINIFYVIDISGSTAGKFNGTPVGDVNGDGLFNTVLDAEIASLQALTAEIQALGFPPGNVTITMVPFNTSADPTTGEGISGPTYNTTTFSSDDAAGMDAFLTSLRDGTATNYEAALDSVLDALAVLDPTGVENNFVYFLSDGIPNQPGGSVPARIAAYADEVQELIDIYDAQISGIGLDGSGTPLDPQFLEALDNTGGAVFVNNTDALSAALLGSPIPSGAVTDLVLTVNGVEVTEIDETDLVSGLFGLSIDTSIDELGEYLGETNEVSVSITFDDGSVLSAMIDIDGILPLSYDL